MATINDAVRQMYLTQTGRAADPGGLEYFANRFGTDSKIDEDEIAIFRQMAAAEVAGQEARQAAAAAQQAAAQQAAQQEAQRAAAAAAQQQQIAQQQAQRAAQQQAEDLARYMAEMQQVREGERGREARASAEAARVLAAQQAATTTTGTGATTAGTTGMTIQQAYQQVLGRTPNAEEIAYWKTQFGDSVDATELSTFSVAAQPERAAAPSTYPKIREMYLSVLGREPDAAGLKYFYDRFGDTVESDELDIFKGMTIQEQTANAARNAGTTTGATTSLTGTGTPGTTTSLTGTTAGTVQPITRPPPVRQVTSSQLAPASFAQTKITGTPFTNLYTPATVQQNAPRLSDIQAAAQSANPYQSLMSLTPQRTLSPAYAAQAGQTTANTNLGGYDSSLYSKPLTGLLAPSTVAGGGGTDLVNNSGDQRGPGTDNTGEIPGLNIDPVALALGRAAGLFGSSVSLGLPAPVDERSSYTPLAQAEADAVAARAAQAEANVAGSAGMGNFGGGSDSFGEGQYAKGGKVNMAPQMHNPPGPDDGYAALDNGEYVIRKSAVKKYGSNIFEQINAGKIPAQRLKSLLE